ncbi:conserved hypothetical protein [Treponema primitia ZAS-2]|uniref:UPF0178 protein TREPR_1651 n=1 Tax=Treponema primitia (strain ATCC BAA-887 / DSM 12427 / ZAS-2) TaxID=545694 RepID=F5YNP3_TREPZ|nr:DUF188 domain-containing protein [Treponema primitia]AEF83827.1 conserved hypothetical protein [Treponema primitia ZAS-2]
MKILVDADSCPRPARELILRTAQRRGVLAIFAANRLIPGIGGSESSDGEFARMELCPAGADSADNRIVELAEEGDLVITRDIPLASRLVEASIAVIDDRGQAYSRENIRERLSLRDFMVDLAESGLGMERIPSYGKRELKAFADGFDRILTKLLKG